MQRITFHPYAWPPASVLAALANTPASRTLGLQGRAPLDEHSGMLFDDGRHAFHSFWMASVPFPLDVIFLSDPADVSSDARREGLASPLTLPFVVQITTAMPGNRTPFGTVARYVLEVAGGWARRHGVVVGTPYVLS
jgi:uncharacterized membrane protein (UPF0127 family)